MKSVLAAGLLATTAFATPLSLDPATSTSNNNNNTNNTIHTRRTTAVGQDSGIEISLWTKPGCKGDKVLKSYKMDYDTNIPMQFLSYKLSDDLGPDDVLAFMADRDWDATGSKGVDKSLNYNPAACVQFAYNASSDDSTAGCHSVPNVLGCVVIRIGDV